MAVVVGSNGLQKVLPRPTPVMVPMDCGAVAMMMSFRPCCRGTFSRWNISCSAESERLAWPGCGRPVSSGGVVRGWPPQRTTQKLRRK